MPEVKYNVRRGKIPLARDRKSFESPGGGLMLHENGLTLNKELPSGGYYDTPRIEIQGKFPRAANRVVDDSRSNVQAGMPSLQIFLALQRAYVLSSRYKIGPLRGRMIHNLNCPTAADEIEDQKFSNMF
ncbi:hypothetical protein OCU04_011143 [Sclerotinia nivalis]|uniref:Uncharacterized protein n=1 Tax=Sclerotinia nivalis TaxID=352851 RepID=A0A9X0AB18_9HELO|nr:hypothetical protein OCU04_011143 [Sclerotinia nivalis]